MSRFVNFRGYGVGTRNVSVAVARVTHFWQIECNGSWCVEVALDSGKTVIVHGFVKDVEKALEAAAAEAGKDVG